MNFEVIFEGIPEENSEGVAFAISEGIFEGLFRWISEYYMQKF